MTMYLLSMVAGLVLAALSIPVFRFVQRKIRLHKAHRDWEALQRRIKQQDNWRK